MLTKTTLNMTGLAHADLVALCELLDLNQTDVINRAVRVYRIIVDVAGGNGGGWLTLLDNSGEPVRIYIV